MSADIVTFLREPRYPRRRYATLKPATPLARHRRKRQASGAAATPGAASTHGAKAERK